MIGFTVRVKTLDVPGRLVEFTDKNIADCTNDELAAYFTELAARGHFKQLAAALSASVVTGKANVPPLLRCGGEVRSCSVPSS